MPAPRLNDSQKEELVVRYRQGETAQALAVAFGCSPNTVSRVLKAALDPGEMEAIKRQSRGRTAAPVADPMPEPEAVPALTASAELAFNVAPKTEESTAPSNALEEEPTILAIDDADDFGDDGLDVAARHLARHVEPVARHDLAEPGILRTPGVIHEWRTLGQCVQGKFGRVGLCLLERCIPER